jgi:hypothetical protein
MVHSGRLLLRIYPGIPTQFPLRIGPMLKAPVSGAVPAKLGGRVQTLTPIIHPAGAAEYDFCRALRATV